MAFEDINQTSGTPSASSSAASAESDQTSTASLLATIAEQGEALKAKQRLILLFKEKQKKLNEGLASALSINAPLESQLNYLVNMKKDSEEIFIHLNKKLAQLQESAKQNEDSLGYYIDKNKTLSAALEDCRTKLEASTDQNLCGTDSDQLDLVRSLRTQIRVLETTNREQSDIIESRNEDLAAMTKLEKENTALKKSLTTKESLLEDAARAGKDAGSATVLKYAKEIKKLKEENEELRAERVYEECRDLVRMGMKVARLEWQNKGFRDERLALFEATESLKEDNARLRVIIRRQSKQLSVANKGNKEDAAATEKLLEGGQMLREKAENDELRAAVEAKDKDLFDAFAANNKDNKSANNNAKGKDQVECNDYSHADLQDENDKLRAANNAKDKALFSAKSFDIEKLIEANLLLFKTLEEKNKKLAALAAAAAHNDIRNGNGNGNGNARADDDIVTKLKAEIETASANGDAKDMQGAGAKTATGNTKDVATNIIVTELNTKNKNLRLTITQKESQNQKLKTTIATKDKELANTQTEIEKLRREQDGLNKEHAEIKEYLIKKVQRLGPEVAGLKGVVKEYEDMMLSKGWTEESASQFAEWRARKEGKGWTPREKPKEGTETIELVNMLQKEIKTLKEQVAAQATNNTVDNRSVLLNELKKMMAEYTSQTAKVASPFSTSPSTNPTSLSKAPKPQAKAQNSSSSSKPTDTKLTEEGISTIELATLLQPEILALKQQIETQGTRVGTLEDISVGNGVLGENLNGRGEVIENHDDNDETVSEEVDSDGEGFSEEGEGGQEDEREDGDQGGDDDTIEEEGADE